MLPIHTILCPIDFSESSLEALAIAVELGEHFASEVYVLHVLELQPTPAILDPLSGAVSVAALHRSELEGNIRRVMEDVVQKYENRSVTMTSLIEDGAAAQKIVQCAQSIGADIIVISTHGRTGWRRFIYGSVAEEVIRTAACPVLSTRPMRRELTEAGA